MAAKSEKSLTDVNKLSLADLGIANSIRLPFERFGIYMVADLLLYRREELIELRGINQNTLTMIEIKVCSRTGEAFRIPGSLTSGAQPRKMTREEMIALDVNLSELRLNPLIMRQLRQNSILVCRQIAFTSTTRSSMSTASRTHSSSTAITGLTLKVSALERTEHRL